MEDRQLLLKLHRIYSKDETVKLQKQYIQELKKQLSISNFKIGEQKSEIAQLEHELNQAINTKNQLKKQQSDFDKKLHKRTQALKKKTKKLQNDVHFWRDKYYSKK